MAIVKRNEGKKVNSNINVTPMVDVMLVLLIIFMVITPMLGDKALKVNPGEDKSVYLSADTRANFGKVEDAIDALRAAQVNTLNLMTDKTYNASYNAEQ